MAEDEIENELEDADEEEDDAYEPPSGQEVGDLLRYVIQRDEDRTNVLRKAMHHLEGTNEVWVPTSTMYKATPRHSFAFLKGVNQKNSRFLQNPRPQVIPFGDSSTDQVRASELENALRYGVYAEERRDGSHVWSDLTSDANAMYGGALRIECSLGTYWPELDVDEEGRDELSREYEEDDDYQKAKERYKKGKACWPIRRTRVPFWDYFPIRGAGGRLSKVLERETRSISEVLTNPTFDTTMLPKYDDYGLRQKEEIRVTIIHYADEHCHAYYALSPRSEWTVYSGEKWPDGLRDDASSIGTPTLLYYYEHGLGRPPYVEVGQWDSNSPHVQRLKAILDQCQILDELDTQGDTNIRTLDWPTLVAYIDPELRPDATDSVNKAQPQIPEGSTWTMLKGEDIRPFWKPESNPRFEQRRQAVIDSIEQLMGTNMLYGQHAPGVATGYHANLLLTQAEHLDNLTEANLVSAAIDMYTMILQYIQLLGEEVYIAVPSTTKEGKKSAGYASIKPKTIKELPMFDCAVRAPRPIDFSAALQDAIQASMDRGGGRGPILSDDTIYSKLLNIDEPDRERRKIAIESSMAGLIGSSQFNNIIMQRIMVQTARARQPEFGATDAAMVDPALLQAINGINASGEPAAMGGVDPGLMQATMEGSMMQQAPPPMMAPSPTQGMGGGMSYGRPQFAQQRGRVGGIMEGEPSGVMAPTLPV